MFFCVHEGKDRLSECEDYWGAIFWTNLGFWLYGYPAKLPFLTFAIFDPADDVFADYNRYPEIYERVSVFQYKNLSKLRE